MTNQRKTFAINSCIFVMLAGLLWVGALVSRADTHYVSLDGTNDSVNGYITWSGAATQIQWAVNAAQATTAGDTVLVSNGTYNLTNRISIASNITVRSFTEQGHGASDTIVDGGYPARTNRCFYMTAGTLDGFTIANGCWTNTDGTWDDGGGGIYLSAATIQNCTVVSNRMIGYCGGGIHCRSGGRVLNCLVTSNSANDKGSGVFLTSAAMSNSVIRGNTLTAAAWGGAVIVYSGESRVTGCVVSNNYGSGYCGLRLCSSGCYASNCVITDNRGPGNSMTIDANALAENCIIRNNILVTEKAGCALYGTLRNSFIHDNNKLSSDSSCYGLRIYSGGIAQNCIISNNAGDVGVRIEGGGTLRNSLVIAHTNNGVSSSPIRTYPSGYTKVQNCTIAFNLNGMYFSVIGGVPTNLVVNTIVQSNTGLNITEAAGSVSWFTNCNVGTTNTLAGVNNINTNPAWVDPANFNLRLSASSPCINRGMNETWMTGAVDLDGIRRILYGTVDMGAYERINAGTIYTVH